MAFSFSYVIKLYFLFVISISSIALEVKSDQNEYGSPYMLLRLKRNPQRAYTFGGFSPSSGYAAFATSDFYPSYYNILSSSTQSRGLSEGRGESFVPSSSENSPNAEYPPSADYQSISDYSAGNGAEDERKVPSSNLTPPSEYAPSINYAPNSQYQGPKKAKKKPFTQANDEDEDEGNMIHRFKRYSNDFGNGIITEMVSFDSLRAVPIVYQFIGSGYYNTYGTYYGYGDYTKEDNFYNYNYPQDYNRHSNTFHSPSKQTSNTYEMNNDFGISSYAPSFNSPSFYISDSPLYYRI